MRSRSMTGLLAGLVAGVFFGVLMQVMAVPAADRSPVPMMMLISTMIGSTSLAAGWLFHLFSSAVIGALFGALLGKRGRSLGKALSWGTAYALGWWILGGMVLMPLFLGLPALSPLMNAPLRPVMVASLSGHLMYGLILGGVYYAVYRRELRRERRRADIERQFRRAA